MWNLAKLLGLITLCATPLPARGQEYPAKPIRLVVPFPPGGPNDIIGRVLGQKMQELLGQLIIIDNRPGAGGALGTDNVAKSEPDGYSRSEERRVGKEWRAGWGREREKKKQR